MTDEYNDEYLDADDEFILSLEDVSLILAYVHSELNPEDQKDFDDIVEEMERFLEECEEDIE